ncbi:hypothetical protein V6N13_113337 [Hibiscus sabdariffa]
MFFKFLSQRMQKDSHEVTSSLQSFFPLVVTSSQTVDAAISSNLPVVLPSISEDSLTGDGAPTTILNQHDGTEDPHASVLHASDHNVLTNNERSSDFSGGGEFSGGDLSRGDILPFSGDDIPLASDFPLAGVQMVLGNLRSLPTPMVSSCKLSTHEVNRFCFALLGFYMVNIGEDETSNRESQKSDLQGEY